MWIRLLQDTGAAVVVRSFVLSSEQLASRAPEFFIQYLLLLNYSSNLRMGAVY